MRVTADHDKCIASGACVLAAPDVFDQDDDGIVVVKLADVGPERVEAALEGVRACPAGVLAVATESNGAG